MSDRASEVPATELPDGWSWVRIGDICQRVSQVDPSKHYSVDFHYIDISAVEIRGLDREKIKTYHKDRAPSRARQLVQSKDILFSTVRVYLKKKGIVPEYLSGSIASTGFTVLRARKDIVPEYIYYWIENDCFVSRMTKAQRGTSYPAVRDDDVFDAMIPLAPFPEQHRIVEKIDRLLSEISNGVESLDAVDRNLNTYRQSVLKAAVTGELSKDARSSGKFSETGAELLQRVLRERASVARSKTKAPLEPGSQMFFKIPETWTVATVDQLSLATDYGTSAKCSATEGDVPVLRMGNLQDGELDLSALKYLPSDRSEFPKLLLRDGDLLFNRTNSAELVGKTSVYRGNPPNCSFASYLVRVNLNGMIPEFLAAFINSIFGRRWIKSVVSQQVGQANVNSTKLRALSVPLPPLTEQQLIVDRMKDLQNGLARARAGAEGQSSRAGSLRRSILDSAFSGRLLPQNSSDEPASELLARIRAERADAPKTSGRRGRPRKMSRTSAGATP